MQMGARPYSPLLGRFLSVDPVEGCSANDYDYVNGDAINMVDLDGKNPLSWAVRAAWQASRSWIVKTAAPWVARNFMRYVGRPVAAAARATARFVVAAVRWKVRTVKKRVVETVTYVKKNPGRAAFRCGVWGGIGALAAGDTIGRFQAAAVGCFGNLVHDGWPVRR